MPMDRKDQAAFDNAMRKLVKHGTPNQPADEKIETLRALLRRCLPHVEVYGNLRAEIEAALAKREERE